jgi:hypothetical protein
MFVLFLFLVAEQHPVTTHSPTEPLNKSWGVSLQPLRQSNSLIGRTRNYSLPANSKYVYSKIPVSPAMLNLIAG